MKRQNYDFNQIKILYFLLYYYPFKRGDFLNFYLDDGLSKGNVFFLFLMTRIWWYISVMVDFGLSYRPGGTCNPNF